MWGTLLCEKIHINKTLLTAVGLPVARHSSKIGALYRGSWRQKALYFHPKCSWHSSVCPNLFGECSLGKEFFPICVCKDFYIKLWRTLRKCFIIWILQLRGGVKQGLKCGSGYPARAAGCWLFPSPGFFFPISLLSRSNSPSAFPARYQHRLRLNPIPAVKPFPAKTPMLDSEILSPRSWQAGDVEWAEVNREASPCYGANPACSKKRSSHSGDGLRIIYIPLVNSALLLWPLSPHKDRSSLTFMVPYKNQISWHASSLLLTQTGRERLKGTQFLLSTWKGFVNSFSGYFFFMLLVRK